MNNYNYMNYNWFQNPRLNRNYYPYTNENQGNNQNIWNPMEGFEKGNLFQSLYEQYQNYKPQVLKPTNEQERLLTELQAISFAIHDLNLYLDVNPNDQSMALLWSDYQKQLQEKKKEYEEKYGPMTVTSSSIDGKISNWVNSKWPWEVDNV